MQKVTGIKSVDFKVTALGVKVTSRGALKQ
jgi:hypothetical protein